MKKKGNEWKEVSKQLLVNIYIFVRLVIHKKREVSHDINQKKIKNNKWNKNIYLDFHIREPDRIVLIQHKTHISLLNYLLVIRFAGALFITLAYKVFRPKQLNLVTLLLFSVCVIVGNLKSKKINLNSSAIIISNSPTILPSYR